MTEESSVIFNPGETIFREGDKSTEMYIILSGIVQVYETTETEDRIILAELGAGAMLGEMSMISGEPRSATAMAKDKVITRIVTREAFSRSVTGIPGWAFGIAAALIERLRRINTIIKKNARVNNLEKSKEIVFIEDFTIVYEEAKNPDLAFIKGYFFANDIPKLEDFIRIILQKHINKLTLDFSDVIDMDKAACEHLKKLNEHLKHKNIKFFIQNIQLVHTQFDGVESLQEVISEISPPRRNVSAGEYIIRQGEASNNLYIIKSGRFEITREIEGKTVKVAEIGAGRAIGEMALIGGSKRSASARAVKPGIIYVIEPQDIHTNKFHIPQWFIRIIQQLISRIGNSNAILDMIVKHEKLNRQILGIELDVMPDASQTGCFKIRGEMTAKNDFVLKKQLVKLINNGFKKIILDFSEIIMMDKSFLSTFNLIAASLASRGGKLSFINVCEPIAILLKEGLLYKDQDVYKEESDNEKQGS